MSHKTLHGHGGCIPLACPSTSAFTSGNGLTCSSQSPRSQSALSCLFYNWDRTTHTLWPWPALVLSTWLLRWLSNSGRKERRWPPFFLQLMNSLCPACHRCIYREHRVVKEKFKRAFSRTHTHLNTSWYTDSMSHCFVPFLITVLNQLNFRYSYNLQQWL